MNVPKGYRPREGDVVAVRAKVRFDFDLDPRDDKNVHVTLDGWKEMRVPLSDLVAVEARTWKKGDRVRNVNDYSDRGEIIAFLDGQAWVKLGGGRFATFSSLDLEDDLEPESDAELFGRIKSYLANNPDEQTPVFDQELAGASGTALDQIAKRYGLERYVPSPFIFACNQRIP